MNFFIQNPNYAILNFSRSTKVDYTIIPTHTLKEDDRTNDERVIKIHEPIYEKVAPQFFGIVPSLKYLVRTEFDIDTEHLDMIQPEEYTYEWPIRRKQMYKLGEWLISCCDEEKWLVLFHHDTHDKIQVYEEIERYGNTYYNLLKIITPNNPYYTHNCDLCCRQKQLDICFMRGYDRIHVAEDRPTSSLPLIWVRRGFIGSFAWSPTNQRELRNWIYALRVIFPWINPNDENIGVRARVLSRYIFDTFNISWFEDQATPETLAILLLMAGIEPNPGPIVNPLDELHGFADNFVTLYNDDAGDLLTSFIAIFERSMKKLPDVSKHTMRVILKVFMFSNTESYPLLIASIGDLVLESNGHLVLDTTVAYVLGKCVALTYRYISKVIYRSKSTSTFQEDLHTFEMSNSQIGGIVGAVGACLASLLVVGHLPKSNDLDKFVNRCHSVPRAFKSVADIFVYFEQCFRAYLADGTLPFLSNIGVTQINKDFDNFVTELSLLLHEIHEDEAMLDTRLCRKAKDLYESQLSLIQVATNSRNTEILTKLRNYSGILQSVYTKAIKAPGSGVQFRQEPCAVAITGPPGVGKTCLARILSMHCYQACGVTKEELDKFDSSSFIYPKLMGQRYWTNYNSVQHAVTIIDDANQVQLNFTDGAPFPAVFINLKNSAACPLEVAECDLKKLAYFNSRLIVVTDNISAAPASQVINDEGAYFRRFDFQVKCSQISEVKDMINFTHLRFDVSIRNLKTNEVTGLFNTDFKTLVPLVIERIGYYAALYKSNANSDQDILKQYYDPVAVDPENNEAPHMATYPPDYSAFGPPRLNPYQLLSVNSLISHLPWYTRFQLMTYFWWSRSVLGHSTVRALMATANRMNVRSYFDVIKSVWRQMRYSEKLLMVTTFLYLISCIACMIRVFFLMRSKAEEQVHSYSNAVKIKRATRVRLSARTLHDKAHSLEMSPPLHPVVKDGTVELERATAPVCMLDSNLEEMLAKISHNVYLVELNTKESIYRNHLTIIKGRIAVTNWHFVERVRDAIDNDVIISFSMKRPIEKTHLITHLDPHLFADTARVWTTEEDFVDAGLVCLGIKVPSHKDISKFLMSTENLINLSSGYMKRLSIHPLRGNEVIHTGALLYRFDPKISYPWNDVEANCSVRPKNVIYYQADSMPGMCGSPVMVSDSTQTRKIVGFAMSFNQTLRASVACHLPPEVVTEYANLLPEILDSYQAKINLISIEDEPLQTSKLDVMKDQPYFEVGKYKHTSVIQRVSAINPSICFDHITKHISKPARLMNFELNGEKIDVLRKAISKNLNSSCKISPEHLDVAKDHIDFLFSKIVGEEKPFILSWEQVIKGGIPGLQPIPRSTSPGAPFVFQSRTKPGKQHYLGSDETYILDNPFLLSQLENFSLKCKQNLRSTEPYTVQLKDETRDFERVAAGKTRSFMACNLTLTCKIREYFGFYFAQTHLNGKTCGLLPGFNPNGDDANFVYRYITEMGQPSAPIFGAGDFSNFDGTLNEEILNLILKKWISSIELTDEQHTEAVVCGINIMNAIYLLSDNLYMNTHSLPSGCPATTILNSWYNSTICAITMYEAVKKRNLQIHKYRDYYRLLVYGDDNLFALSGKLCDSNISQDITKTMSDLGMAYTSGTKKGDILFTTLWQNEILKRSFKFNSTLSRYTMPLRLSVILESLNWDRKKNQRDKIEQFLQNVDFVVRELSLHGPDIYNEYYSRISAFAMKHAIELPYYSYRTALDLLNTE